MDCHRFDRGLSLRLFCPDSGLDIVGANKRNYTQLHISVYGIVYDYRNVLIYSVVCGA